MKNLFATTALAMVVACCLTAPASAALLNPDGSPVASDPNLALWLKADALGLADGASVATWTKSSDNGSDAFQGDFARQPIFTTNVLNGQPVVRFDGGDDFLDTTGVIPATGADPRSIFAVVNGAGNTSIAYRHIAHYGSTTQNEAYGLVSKSLGGQTGVGGGINVGNHYWANGFSSSQVPNDGPQLLTISYDGAFDRLFANGELRGRKAVLLNTGSAQSLKIGSRISGPLETLLGDIAELIVYGGQYRANGRQ